MRGNAVVLKNVSKSYDGTNYVLRDIDLTVREGEIILVSGQSGCGKTTFLNLIGGLDSPTGGKIYVDSNDITKLGEDGLASVRLHHIGFVFQSYNLIKDLTVSENVALPRKLAHLDHGKRVKYLLKRFGLWSLNRKYPHEISGGEAQRVAIARALANQPKVVLADEPTGNLDRNSSLKVLETFKMMNSEFNTTLIIVSHEMEIERWAHIHYTIEDGTFMEA
jgi:putative ABC transport system ATP-binding protein